MTIQILKPSRLLRACAALVMALSLVSQAWAQTDTAGCGSLSNGNNGPFDYRTERGPRLKVVEANHFTPNIESLVRGNTGTLGGELGYTLSAFPNHHRALLAMERLTEKIGTPHPSGAQYGVDCYFERAVRFRPDDSTARLIYANYLAKKNRTPEATQQLQAAVIHAGDNALTHYNAGLIYIKIKNYTQARIQAQQAQDMGLGLTGLRDQLAALGQWEAQAASKPMEPTLAE